jgi:hypothetical protein
MVHYKNIKRECTFIDCLKKGEKMMIEPGQVGLSGYLLKQAGQGG